MNKTSFTIIMAETGVLLILLIIIILLGFQRYQVDAQSTYKIGQAAFTRGECLEAISEFSRIKEVYQWAPIPEIQLINGKIQECSLLMFAENALTSKDYPIAITAYDAYLTFFPKSTFVQSINRQKARIYYEWANKRVSGMDYEAALRLYQVILDEYTNVYLPRIIQSEIVSLYTRWGDQHYNEKAYTKALDKYRRAAFIYPQLPGVDQIPGRMLTVYQTWTNELLDTSHYDQIVEINQDLLLDNQIFRQSEISQRALNNIATSYDHRAYALLIEGKYEEAIHMYQVILNEYPKTSASISANEKIMNVYIEWIDSLRKANEYQATLDKIAETVLIWQDNIQVQNLKNQYPEIYLEWGNSLKIKGVFAQAIDKYQVIILKFPDSSITQDAKEAIANTYIAWGNQKVTEQLYWDAINKFELAKLSTSESNLIQESENAYLGALQKLAYDSSGQGAQLLEIGLVNACNGHPQTLDIYDVSKGHPGKMLVCNHAFALPEDLKATSPADFRYIATQKPAFSKIQTCKYKGEKTIIRRRSWWQITLRSALTNEVIEIKVFYGLAPDTCPEVAPSESGTVYLDGPDPSLEQIYTWLRDNIQ